MPGGIPQPQPNWTLLRMIQEFCRRQNLQVPQGVVASTDEEVTQLWGLLNESVMSLSTRGDWPHLNRRFEFLHQRAENYMALNLWNPIWEDNVHPQLAWSGGQAQIKYLTRATLWEKATGIPVAGPLSDQDWAAMLAQKITPAVYSWRLHYLGLCIYPYPPPDTPTSQTRFVAEVKMRETVMDGDQVTFKETFTLDNDLCLLPADVLLADLRWRWRAEKGLAYAEHFRVAEDLILDILSKGSGAGTVILDSYPSYPQVIKHGLLIPAGSWDVHN